MAGLTTAAILGLTGIMTGGSVASGIIGSKGAKSAADIQANAAQQAGQLVVNTANQVNPQITTAANNGMGWVNDAAQYASGVVTDATGKAAAGVTGAAQDANGLLQPYVNAGTSAVSKLSDLAGSSAPTMDQLQLDPGFEFRLQQGAQAIQRAQAARGVATGGAAAKALTRYSQGVASDEYSKAFDRFELDRNNRFAMLSDLSGKGLNAAGKSGDNTIFAAGKAGDYGVTGATYAGEANRGAADFGARMNYDAASQTANNSIRAASTAADAITGGANARAAGTVGSANAWGGALQSGTSNAAQLILLSQLAKKQSATPTPGATK